MFTAILSAIAPVFGLILIGVACARRNVLPDGAFEVLNRLDITATVPALTFAPSRR